MRKKIHEVIKQSVKQSLLDFVWFSAKLLGIFILAVILYKNIVASQAVNSLYFQLANEEKKAMVSFLKKIETLPDYEKYLGMAKVIYGVEFDQEIREDYFKRKAQINKIELALQKNPKSRDVLYLLSKLYEQQKDQEKAQFYLNKAREIDPTIK